MNAISRLLQCDGSTDRPTYQRNIALLALGRSTVDLTAMIFQPQAAPLLIAEAWVNPFVLIGPWLRGELPLITCLSAFAYFSAVVWNSVHRVRDIGWNHWLGLLTAVPFIGPAATLLFALAAGRKRTVWDLT